MEVYSACRGEDASTGPPSGRSGAASFSVEAPPARPRRREARGARAQSLLCEDWRGTGQWVTFGLLRPFAPRLRDTAWNSGLSSQTLEEECDRRSRDGEHHMSRGGSTGQRRRRGESASSAPSAGGLPLPGGAAGGALSATTTRSAAARRGRQARLTPCRCFPSPTRISAARVPTPHPPMPALSRARLASELSRTPRRRPHRSSRLPTVPPPSAPPALSTPAAPSTTPPSPSPPGTRGRDAPQRGATTRST